MVKPVLRWAGGKRRQLKTLLPLIRDNLADSGTYIEPFLGGGSVAFALNRQGSILNDASVELMNTYRQIRDDPGSVAGILTLMQQMPATDAYYKRIRSSSGSEMYNAGRMLWLNAHAFNGLYRLNKKGEFNVPQGTAKPVPDYDRLVELSELLKTQNLYIGHFARVVRMARAGDVVYCDPPYDGTFTSYTGHAFDAEEQDRLAFHLKGAADRGASIIVSNSDTPLIRRLYSWANIEPTAEKRSIAAAGNKRKKAPCLLITAL